MRADWLAMTGVVLVAWASRRAAVHARSSRVHARLSPSVGSTRLAAQPWSRPALLLFVGALLGRMSFGWVGTVPGLIGAIVVEHGLRTATRSREAARIEHDLPIALETIARVLRSGTSPLLAIDEAAIGMSGPIAQDLRELATAASQFGLRAATLAWGGRRPQALLAARSMVVALDAGRGAADGLDAVAITIRERNAVLREVRALAAQARLSAAVMACTPVGFAALLCGSDPDARTFLIGSRQGLACLVTGLLMDLVGYRWMRAIAAVPL